MLFTLSGVAQSFLAPCETELVAETRAMSTGSSRTVASKEVRVMMATMLTTAERSRGVCQVKVVMMAARKQRTTTMAYVVQIKLVCTRPASAMVDGRHWSGQTASRSGSLDWWSVDMNRWQMEARGRSWARDAEAVEAEQGGRQNGRDATLVGFNVRAVVETR